MADAPGLQVEVGISLKKLTRQLAVAEARMHSTAKKSEAAFRKNNAKIAKSFEKIDKAAQHTGVQIGGLRNILIGAFSVREIKQYADAWTEAGNKIAAMSELTGVQTRSLSALNDLAAQSRSGFSETAATYARLLQATKGVAKSEEEVARATDLLNKAFKAGGASAQEQASGLMQLSQALGSGVLQGDELRSLRENAPLVAQLIADEFGTTIGHLKKLGAEGKLTSDRVFRGLLAGQTQIEAAFAKTRATLGESFTGLRNALVEYIGAADNSLGATAKLSMALGLLAENIDLVVVAGLALGTRVVAPILLAQLAKASTTILAASTALRGLSTGAAATTVALRGLSGVLAVFGGPLGAVVTGLLAAAYLITDAEETLAELSSTTDKGTAAMRDYAAALDRAAKDQETLGGKISATTAAMLGQSRAALQIARDNAAAAVKAARNELIGVGLFDRSEVNPLVNRLERNNGIGVRRGGIEDMLRGFQKGEVAAEDLNRELQRLAGAGREVGEVLAALDLARLDPAGVDLEGARRGVLQLARDLQLFEKQLANLDRAKTPEQLEAAFKRLAGAMLAASQTGAVLREEENETFFELLNLLVENAEKAAQLSETLRTGAVSAEALGAAAGSIDPLVAQTESAKEFADQLERALGIAEALVNSGISEVTRAQIAFDFKDDPVGRAGALAKERFDAKIGFDPFEPPERLSADLRAQLQTLQGQQSASVAAAEKVASLRVRAAPPRGPGRASRATTKEEEKPFFEASDEDIARLNLRLRLVGKGTAATATATLKQHLLNEAKRRGLDLDAEYDGEKLIDQINRQAEATGKLAAKTEKATEKTRFLNQQNAALQDGFVGAIVDGENLSGVLQDLARDYAKAALKAALFGTGPLAPGGGVGGLFGALLGSVFSVAGARASGGPVSGGGSYLVGERGPELFTPNNAGHITPHGAVGQNTEITLRILAEEGPLLRPLITATAMGSAVRVVQDNNQTLLAQIIEAKDRL